MDLSERATWSGQPGTPVDGYRSWSRAAAFRRQTCQAGSALRIDGADPQSVDISTQFRNACARQHDELAAIVLRPGECTPPCPNTTTGIALLPQSRFAFV